MIKAVIVDDEPLACDLLEAILADIETVEIVAICSHGSEAIEAVINHAPDVLFLDIEMPGLNGFDVIKALQSDILPKIIFTTAYSDYAIEAFKVNAINYIMKPIHEKAVKESLERVQNSMSVETKSTMLKVLEPHATERALALIESSKITMINKEDIVWLEAASDYVYVHLQSGTKIVRRTLKAFLADLPSNVFQKIHRSTIVNIDHVSEMITQKKGEAILVMSDDRRLKVSRTYGSALRDRLKGT